MQGLETFRLSYYYFLTEVFVALAPLRYWPGIVS